MKEKRYNILLINSDDDNNVKLNLENILKSEFNIFKTYIDENEILFYGDSFTVIRYYKPDVIIYNNNNNFYEEKLKIIRKIFNNIRIPLLIILKDLKHINYEIFTEYGIFDFILHPVNIRELKYKILCNLNYLDVYKQETVNEIKYKFTEYVVNSEINSKKIINNPNFDLK